MEPAPSPGSRRWPPSAAGTCCSSPRVRPPPARRRRCRASSGCEARGFALPSVYVVKGSRGKIADAAAARRGGRRSAGELPRRGRRVVGQGVPGVAGHAGRAAPGPVRHGVEVLVPSIYGAALDALIETRPRAQRRHRPIDPSGCSAGADRQRRLSRVAPTEARLRRAPRGRRPAPSTPALRGGPPASRLPRERRRRACLAARAFPSSWAAPRSDAGCRATPASGRLPGGPRSRLPRRLGCPRARRRVVRPSGLGTIAPSGRAPSAFGPCALRARVLPGRRFATPVSGPGARGRLVAPLGLWSHDRAAAAAIRHLGLGPARGSAGFGAIAPLGLGLPRASGASSIRAWVRARSGPSRHSGFGPRASGRGPSTPGLGPRGCRPGSGRSLHAVGAGRRARGRPARVGRAIRAWVPALAAPSIRVSGPRASGRGPATRAWGRALGPRSFHSGLGPAPGRGSSPAGRLRDRATPACAPRAASAARRRACRPHRLWAAAARASRWRARRSRARRCPARRRRRASPAARLLRRVVRRGTARVTSSKAASSKRRILAVRLERRRGVGRGASPVFGAVAGPRPDRSA